MRDLLPPNATPLERALAAATARLSDVPVPVGDLWSPERCPVEWLPWLAWALSVDEWDSGWPEQRKRQAIAQSAALHRHKGTVWSVREALRRAGYAAVEFDEGPFRLAYDGSAGHDGTETYDGSEHWARFDMLLDLGEQVGVSAAESRLMRSIIERYAPASRHLRTVSRQASMEDRVGVRDAVAGQAVFTYEETLPEGPRYDGSAGYDGFGTYGIRGDLLEFAVIGNGQRVAVTL